MKIVVTAQGNDLDSPVDTRFARARYFLVVDTESGEYEVVDNTQNVNAAHGAGPQAAQKVAGLGVEAVVTGHCGPRAFAALSAGGVKMFTGASGSVRDAIEAFKNGELSETAAPDVQGHWV